MVVCLVVVFFWGFFKDADYACENEVITKFSHCEIEAVTQMLSLQFNPLVQPQTGCFYS